MNAHALPRQQLLLVDDEEDALLELAELLEGEGFNCFTATSVKFALQHLTRHPDIALVITDLRMPEESGMSLIRRLREHTSRQHLPVIVTSGHADMEDVSDMLRLQVLDLFRKPIYHVRLLETLNNLFPQPEMQRLVPGEGAEKPQVYRHNRARHEVEKRSHASGNDRLKRWAANAPSCAPDPLHPPVENRRWRLPRWTAMSLRWANAPVS